jgi:hypothetical protein
MLSRLSEEIIEKYNLREIAVDGSVYNSWQESSTCTKCHTPVDTFSVWVLQANLDMQNYTIHACALIRSY